MRWLVLLVIPCVAEGALAAHDPATTATIVVGGFDQGGVQATGVFGDVEFDPLLDDIAALAGLPTSSNPDHLFLPNVVTTTEYYGDTPPDYYDAADLADLDAVTAQWGGGVPRHALIVAKFARHVLQTSGAAQVNFVSTSFGSLVVRWLVEKNLEGLAAEGRIARWLSVEGLLDGSWPASQPTLIDLWELAQSPPLDVDHMAYDWVEANLHSPRTTADHPAYANILLGAFGSTDDNLNERALTVAMLAADEFQANDGVQGVEDTYFHDVAPQSRLEGLPPLRSFYHDDHYGIATNRGAWAQAALFLTSSRRVTVTMTRARVNDIHENFFLRPAEIVFESSVFSPTVGGWGIEESIARQEFEGAGLPIRHFTSDGQDKYFEQVLFDGMLPAEESSLDVRIGATEIDLELRYGVAETVIEPFLTDLGSTTVTVPIPGGGPVVCQAPGWDCDLVVNVHTYAFGAATDVAVDRENGPSAPRLQVFPNPARGAVRIVTTSRREGAPATLRILDAAGRLLRRLEGGPRVFRWDGRDSAGRPVAGGVYFYELREGDTIARGKGTILR